MELQVRIPILFGAFWIVRSLVGERRADLFVFLLSCLIAATWWASGWGKVRIGWITHPHIDLLLLGAHANGWLGFLESDAAVRIAHVVAAVRIPLMIFTLVVECGALLILWRRWSLPAFLVLTSTLHIGAFALTGIFFWKWILIDLAFLTFLLHRRRVERLRIFSFAHFALADALILGSRAWVAARNLTFRHAANLLDKAGRSGCHGRRARSACRFLPSLRGDFRSRNVSIPDTVPAAHRADGGCTEAQRSEHAAGGGGAARRAVRPRTHRPLTLYPVSGTELCDSITGTHRDRGAGFREWKQ